MSQTTNLNDRWSRVAASISDEPTKTKGGASVPASRGSSVASPQPYGSSLDTPRPSAAAVAGLSPEDVRRLAAKFSRPPGVAAADKNGVAATAAGSVVSVWLDVTPDMAARWLKVNFRNRPLSDDTVQAYARDMAAGRWQPTHQGIAFNDRDQLIDGQHRLAAVVRIGRPVRMMVTFGLPDKIAGSEITMMDCVDRGRPRSVADQLKIQHGLKQAGVIASLSASLAHLCVGERMRRLSVGQTLDIYRAFQPGIEYVIERRSREKGLKTAAVLAAFAFVFPVAPADVKVGYPRLVTGNGLEKSPSLKLLREFLLQNESIVMMRNMHRGIVELVTHAIWQDVTRPAASQLEMNPDEWMKAVDHFRRQQSARVTKIAALFKLPA